MAKKAAAKKSAGLKKSAAKARGKAASSKKPAARTKAAAKGPTLGRPRVTQDEPLYLLFKENYPARQIFEFLRVNTVGELEQHSATEIFRRLTQPVRDTVESIRRTLAEYNRCLEGDLDYALEKKAERTEK
jgi:hypothetical protein